MVDNPAPQPENPPTSTPDIPPPPPTPTPEAPATPTPPTTPAPPPNPKIKETKPYNWPVIILSLLLLVAIGFAGSFGYLYYQSPQQPPVVEEPVSTPTPDPIPDPTANWETYSNSQYKLTFKYPRTYTIEENLVSTSNFLQVIFNKNKLNEFNIKASTDYPPGNTIYFLDTESTGQETINDQVWKTYYLPDGYGNGPEPSTTPIYGLLIEINEVLYTSTFYNQSSIDSTQKQILSSLEFSLEKNESRPCVQSGCNCLSKNVAALSGIDLCADQQSPELTCYNQAICELQTNEECGWTQTTELIQCLQQY